jgi:hypothetical protein
MGHPTEIVSPVNETAAVADEKAAVRVDPVRRCRSAAEEKPY